MGYSDARDVEDAGDAGMLEMLGIAVILKCSGF